MLILEGYSSEAKTASEIKKSIRTLQVWRRRRQGPAWTRIGKTIFYRHDALIEWLKSQEQQPVRSRKHTHR